MPPLGLVTHEPEGPVELDHGDGCTRASSSYRAAICRQCGGGGRVRPRRAPLRSPSAARTGWAGGPAAQRGLDQACAPVDMRAVPHIAWTEGILARAIRPRRPEEPSPVPRAIGA